MTPIEGLKNVTVQSILEKVQKIAVIADKQVSRSYKLMIDFFRQSGVMPNEIELKAQLIGSWLPYCFKTAGEPPDHSAIRYPLTINQLKRLVDWLGGSIVAASKFLHFSYPQQYPIFDSNVVASISDPAIDCNIEGYLNFVGHMQNVLPLGLQYMAKLREQVCAEEGASDVRVLEKALYLIGREIRGSLTV